MDRRDGFFIVGMQDGGVAPDTTAPTVTITSTESSPTGANPIPLTFTLSEVSTDFAVGDITVGAGGSIGNFAGSGTAYTADLTVTTVGATITVDVAADSFTDAAGNGNTAATQFSITSSIRLVDSFDRADSATSLGNADMGGAWTALSGTWGISGNKAYLVSNTAQATAVLEAGIADGTLVVYITTSPTANRVDCGIVCRAIDTNNYLLFVMQKSAGSNLIRWFKKDAGSYTVLQTDLVGGLVENTTYKVSIAMSGNVLTASIDDVSRLAHTLTGDDITKFATPTKCGLRINYAASGDDKGTRFDNLRMPPNP